MDNFTKSLWVIDQLYHHSYLSFAQLAQRWELSAHHDGKPLSNSTFRRRNAEIAERMNIEIVYDPQMHAYTIENREQIASNAVYQYLLGAFHISSLSALAQKHHNKVQLQAPPAGVELLHPILDAIDRNRSLFIKYQSYYAPVGTIYDYELIPCFVRMFEGRWYLIAQYLDKSKVRVLALDRVLELTIGERKCVADPDINAEQYYAHCYGIVRDDQKPEIVRIRAEKPQDDYLRSLPLHESQKEVEHTDQHTVFEYFVWNT